jgi:hypothetical protein
MRMFNRFGTVVSVAGLVFASTFFGATAGAQVASSTVTIRKNVLGTAPAGTVFTVTYTCDVPADPASDFSGTVQFDATGNALGSDSFTAVSGTHCTVTETDNGGATGVSYHCTTVVFGPCEASGDAFTVGDTGDPIEVAVDNIMAARVDVGIFKIVSGTAPPGTVFTVTYTCDTPADPASDFSGTVRFNAIGIPLSSSNKFTAVSGTHCRVTETDNGGATSVHYLCEDIPRGNACYGLQTQGFADFTVKNFDGGVGITVQNEMGLRSATPTPPVVMQPALTG